ncbi:MAG: flagellar filament capping protein FliD [Planctomycetaceae bacterium]
MPTIDGLNSGLDTEAVIQGLLDIQKTHIDRLSLKKQDVQSERAAFQALEARLVNFRSSATRLARTQNNVFEARTVSVSDESAIVASASSSAASGIYQLTVESLAQAHQVASQGFSDADSEITHGTFIVQQGSRPPLEITIDDTNDTLQGLADSINLAQSGVSASIVQDGTSGSPFRLLLTSSKTGEANAITVTNNLAASSGGAVQPTFDFGNPVQEATNAAVRLGTGTGAFTVQSETNRIDNLISGVTLDLLQADAGRPITVQVAQDTETGVSAVQDFVDSYNSLVDFIAENTGYNTESNEAGLLLGNRSLIQIESEIQAALNSIVPGLSSSVNRLSTIGIRVNDNGKLSFNSSTLQKALNGETDGVTARDVRRLFALDGTSTNPNIQFVLGTANTQASADAIEIDVTRAAERASIAATSALSASTVIDGTNKELTITIDNAELTVTLAEGTYTTAELASELESVINSHTDAKGRQVSVGLQDDGFGSDQLTITSETYGGSSQVTINSGSAMAALGFSGTENDQGVDVEGHFIVNGVIEEATGSGRLLSGKKDNANTEDLQVRITMTASQVIAGAEGEMTISRGFASRLDQVIGDMLDSETGIFKTVNDRFVAESDSIDSTIERQQELYDKQEQNLIAQFIALETALGELQSTSSFLTAQFASLSNLRTSSK